MAENSWADQLPRSLKLRLEGIGNYTTAVLDEANLLEDLPRSSIREIQLAAFLKSLDEFLRDGSDAAARAVDTFEAVGVSGFRVGTEVFEGRNAAVTRGARLSRDLRESIVDQRMLELLASNQSLRQMVISMGTLLVGRRR